MKWKNSCISLFFLGGGVSMIACNSLVRVDPPITTYTKESTYSADGTAMMAVNGLYAVMSNTGTGISSEIKSLNVYLPAFTDELDVSSLADQSIYNYYIDNVTAAGVGSAYWSALYNDIYRCNDIIEGLSSSQSLTPSVKQELLGETLFMRSFFYYYLVNLYGNACWITSSDYKVNSLIGRTDINTVLGGVANDLLAAQNDLAATFLNGTLTITSEDRYRPNKFAATLLLSKIYLQLGKWDQAEEQASAVISNSGLFQMTDIAKTFLVNNKEAIWQLQSVDNSITTAEGLFYILPDSIPSPSNPCTISNTLLSSFEPGDLRKTDWINKVPNGSDTFYVPYKYKVSQPESSPSEALTMFRLADAYLSRAEARAHLNKLPDALNDLNVVRVRAGLDSLVGLNQQQCLDAVLHERQVEFFTEFAARFIDLKRFNKLNEVMAIAAPTKGGSWSANKGIFPLPTLDLSRNLKLVQNPGY